MAEVSGGLPSVVGRGPRALYAVRRARGRSARACRTCRGSRPGLTPRSATRCARSCWSDRSRAPKAASRIATANRTPPTRVRVARAVQDQARAQAARAVDDGRDLDAAARRARGDPRARGARPRARAADALLVPRRPPPARDAERRSDAGQRDPAPRGRRPALGRGRVHAVRKPDRARARHARETKPRGARRTIVDRMQRAVLRVRRRAAALARAVR